MCSQIDEFNWEEIRSASDSGRLPAALRILASSEDVAELQRAYWMVDNEAVVQGVLFESALPVAVCLLSMLEKAGIAARPFVLELLLQLMSGLPSESEVDRANSDLQRLIRERALGYVDVFFDLIDDEDAWIRLLCVDILGICAVESRSVLRSVKEKLVALRGRFRDHNSNMLLENWLLRFAETDLDPPVVHESRNQGSE